MANTTSTTVGSVIETRVATILTQVLIQESVALPTIMDYSSQVGPGIDTLDLPLFTNLAVQDVSESAAMTAQTINPSAASLVLDRHKAVPFSISRRAGMQSKIALVPEALRNGGKALAAEIDDRIFSDLDGNASTAAPDHLRILTASPLDDLLLAKNLLDLQNIPKSDRFVAASPGFTAALLGENNVIRLSEYGSVDPIQNGFVTKAFGFTIVESSSASIRDSGFIAYHRSAEVFARQINSELRSEEKVLEMRTDWVLSQLYGAQPTDPDGTRVVVFDVDGV